MINALPAAGEITLDDKADVEAARAAYDALRNDQKALIDADTLKQLTDAEESIKHSNLVGDVNFDGRVDIIDAVLIQKYIVNKIDKFPVEEQQTRKRISGSHAVGEPDFYCDLFVGGCRYNSAGFCRGKLRSRRRRFKGRSKVGKKIKRQRICSRCFSFVVFFKLRLLRV